MTTLLDSRSFLRWCWRQLTSMRTALILLLLLGIAAIPGSLFPQRTQNPLQVKQYFIDNPSLAPWLDRFSFLKFIVHHGLAPYIFFYLFHLLGAFCLAV